MPQPIPFKQQNSTFSAPPGMTDCCELPTWKGDEQIISKWKLTTDEIEEVKRTGFVYLHIFGTQMPPVAISITDPWAPPKDKG